MIEVRDTGTTKGRGVFALTPFNDGDVVEVCPVIWLTSTPYQQLPVELRQIVFDWGVLAQFKPVIPTLVLGYGSLYNHANPAATRYHASSDARWLIISAVRRIEPGEEITINYNNSAGEPISTEDTYFSANGIAPWSA